MIIKETKVFIRDSATQTTRDVETQTGIGFSFSCSQFSEFLNWLGKTTSVVDGRPSFSCRKLAEKLTILTGLSIQSDCNLHSFK